MIKFKFNRQDVINFMASELIEYPERARSPWTLASDAAYHFDIFMSIELMDLANQVVGIKK